VPKKRIHTHEDFSKWQSSKVYKTFVNFITSLNDSVKGKKISDPCPVSPPITGLLAMLAKMSQFIDEIPPSTLSTRYGNKSFRTWYEKVENESASLVLLVIPADKPFRDELAAELAPYLFNSVGNHTRIDYGSGHEASFVSLLCAMNQVGLFTAEDFQPLVTRVFCGYLDLARKLQRVYCLEPAGSHGVYGLDDYQFLPFLFGSAQMLGQSAIKPMSIHEESVIKEYSDDYMYLGCIKFIKEMKKGPFAEHSSQLNSISYVPHQLWTKINNGMFTMYSQEVLNKYPVIQHFLFGSILPFE